MDKMIDLLMLVVVPIILIFGVILMVVYLPAEMYASGKCLEKGYPKAEVTLSLDSYCINLEGETKSKVYKLGE